jgi:acyl-CoA synthetase (AMP-forming)/AMP-acid ligase II
MLFNLWSEIVRQRANEPALWDLAAGRRWSFRDLAEAVEKSRPFIQPMAHPQGNGAEFILTVLRAWRDGKVVCPLEPDQAPPPIPQPPAGCKHLKLTSATSGAARMIAFTEDQLAADALNIVQTMGLRPDWPNLGAISMAHSYGFSNLVLPLLLHGIPLILAPSALPEIVRQAAAAHRSLTLAGVPALWRAWHEAGAIPANVVLAISAGAPLSIELEQAVHAGCGLKIHNFYGSSECGGIAYDDTPTPRIEEGMVGRAMRQVDLALTDEGCLRVRSRAVGETYWPMADESLGNGRFQTSDLAEFRNGELHLRGRVGDLINVAGRKVSPGAIEQVLRVHPAVKDCLVFGAPDTQGERTDRIVACVVANGSGLADAEPLRQFLLRNLPAWQMPRDWWFVDTLGANNRGKISRAEWRRRYTARHE